MQLLTEKLDPRRDLPAKGDCFENRLESLRLRLSVKISIIFGTRPEAIKLASVILRIRKDARFKCRVCVTAQHRQMLDQVLEIFGIQPDVDLDLMRPSQSLARLSARALEALDCCLATDLAECLAGT